MQLINIGAPVSAVNGMRPKGPVGGWARPCEPTGARGSRYQTYFTFFTPTYDFTSDLWQMTLQGYAGTARFGFYDKDMLLTEEFVESGSVSGVWQNSFATPMEFKVGEIYAFGAANNKSSNAWTGVNNWHVTDDDAQNGGMRHVAPFIDNASTPFENASIMSTFADYYNVGLPTDISDFTNIQNRSTSQSANSPYFRLRVDS